MSAEVIAEHAARVDGARSSARFWWLFSLVAMLLAEVIVAAFLLPQPWSWLIGLLYIGYETWLTALVFVRSRRAVVEELAHPPIMTDGSGPTLAVLIAARDERLALPATLSVLAAQARDGDEILVIDDGSRDGSVAWLEAEFALTWDGELGRSSTWPVLRVLRKENGGKARALNAGLAVTSAEVVVTLDADTILDPGALAALRAAYVRDPVLTVACGVLTPVCVHGWSAAWFGLFQRMEYWRSFLWRMGWMRERTLVLVSGAFAAYRRTAVAAIGGFNPASKAEDYELMFRLHRAEIVAGRILGVAVVSDARAVTDAPGTPLRFLRQRRRWFAGFIETLIANRDLVGDARAGALGRSHLVVKTVDLLLPLYGLAALITLAVFLIAGGGVHPSVLAALAAKLLYDVVIHLWALSLYSRWQGRALGWWVVPLILVEPLLFQPLRQLGALLGWIDHLKRRIDWTPQRPTGAPA